MSFDAAVAVIFLSPALGRRNQKYCVLPNLLDSPHRYFPNLMPYGKRQRTDVEKLMVWA